MDRKKIAILYKPNLMQFNMHTLIDSMHSFIFAHTAYDYVRNVLFSVLYTVANTVVSVL